MDQCTEKFQLNQCEMVSKRKKKNRKNVFAVNIKKNSDSKNFNVYFEVDSENERDEWVNLISAAIFNFNSI